MKRLVLLLVVALLALPSLALAVDNNCTTDPACVTQVFQAYGELTGSYAVGAASVEATFDSVDTKVNTVDCLANACPTYDRCGNLQDTACGLNIGVRETSRTTTSGTLNQLTAIGSNSMSMLGTASVCGTPGGFAAGTGFTEYQNIALNSNFSGGTAYPGVTGSAVYNAGQVFNAAPAPAAQ